MGPGCLILAIVALIASVGGALRSVGSGWSATALALFATYTAWTFASLLWSPNRGRRVMYAVETVTGVDYLLKEIL